MRATAVLFLLVAPLAFGLPNPFQLFQNAAGRRAGPAEIHSSDKPWFCHDLECPSYDLLNKTSIYETRRYSAGTWAATKVEGLLYTPSVTVGFKRLFSYIQGENEDSVKIEMTAPVLVAVQPGQGPFCKSNFSINFFMEEKFQSNPPEPSSPLVEIGHYPREVVYVHQFGGFLVDDLTLAAKVKTLKAALAADNLRFEESQFFTASYDPPTRISGRHNEVMLRAFVA